MDLDLLSKSPVGRLAPIRGTDGRTGRPYNHMAFVPLPLDDEVDLSRETWRVVSRASLALGRLDQAALQLPNPALLRRPTLRREAQSTSALEGTFAPLERVLADDEEDESNPADTAALGEVLNYVRAADAAFSWIQDGGNVTVGLLEASHQTLVRGTRAQERDPGRIRTIQVAIGADRVPIEDARFVPMPPGIELNVALQDLVGWIDQERGARDPVISAAMAHYQFEALHPFTDGNGRIGRLLIVLQLLRGGVLREPLLSVSPWFEERRDEYQQHLFNVSALGDWDSWVRFFSSGLEGSADDTLARVEALLRLQDEYQERLKCGGVRGGIARDIATLLIGYPSFTVPSLRKRLEHATPQGVSSAVRQLVGLGILEKHEGRYRHRYIARDVIEVLSDGYSSS